MDHPTLAPLDDTALLRGLADASLPPGRFDHRAHLRAAFLQLRAHGDFAAAAAAFLRDLRRYVAAHGAAHRFHATISHAYLALLAARMHHAPALGFDALVARHPDLLDHRGGALARHYDVAAITADPVAAAVFVLPGDRP
jgi:hypothetical protein